MGSAEKIIKYIDDNKNQSIDFLRKMVNFDSSVTEKGKYRKEREIQNWLASILEKEGFTTRLFEPNNSNLSKYPDYNPNHNYDGRPNLVATLKGSGAGKSLILNGHVDT